jgi:hypothetical protein
MNGFRVDRSVEWVLERSTVGGAKTVLGRGLMTRNSGDATTKSDYYIWENNTALESSGFYLRMNANTADVAAILLAQSIQTADLAAVSKLSLTTKSDIIKIESYANGVDQSKVQNWNLADGLNIDLGKIYNGVVGSLPTLVMNKVRGFTNLVGSSPNNYLWKLNVRPDSYALAMNKTVINNNNGKVLYSKDTGVSSGNMVLNFNEISLLMAYLDVTSPTLSDSAFVKIGYFVHGGNGKVLYQILDFTSNYNNTLQEVEVGNANFVFGDPSLNAFKVPMPTGTWLEAPIEEVDGTKLGFTISDITGIKETIKFSSGSNLPTEFNGKTSALLYTGRRPIINYNLETNTNATLANLASEAYAVNDKAIFNTAGKGALSGVFGIKGANFYNKNIIIGLTNGTASGSLNMRSLSYSPKAEYFSIFTPYADENKNFIGTYNNFSNIFQDFKLRVQNGTHEKDYALSLAMLQSEYDPSVSSQQIRTQAVAGSATKPTTLSVSADGGLNYVFKMAVNSTPSAFVGFRADIDKATTEVYEIVDLDDDGEVDINKTNNFGLNNSFSELVFLLSSSNTNLRVPNVVASWTGDDAWHSLPGAGLNIKLSGKWSVGYNLDAFFTIRHQDVARFQVLTIETEAHVQAGGQTNNALMVRDARDLRIAAPGDWASSKVGATEPLSGLSFKLRNTVNLEAGQIVRLFVDNAISENTNQWNVTCSNTQAAKPYKLYTYDQEAYARLLDEQVRLTNSFA